MITVKTPRGVRGGVRLFGRFAAFALVSIFVFLLFSSAASAQKQSLAMVDFVISGNVKADGANLAGATVALAGSSSATTTTDASGNYSLTAAAGGNYTVSVYKNGFAFSPASQSLTNLQTNQTADFQSGVPLCAPVPTGLTNWYKGDGNANDSIGGNNGANAGATYDSVYAKVGQSFSLNGSTSYVQIADNASNRLTDSGSISLWLRLSSAADGVILDKGRADNNLASYTWEIYQGTLRFDLYKGDGTGGVGTGYVFVLFNASEIVGQWTQLTATWEAGTLRLYRNGALHSTANYSFTRQARTDFVGIGRSTNGTRPPINGYIDELQFYNRALAAPEIQSIYNAGSKGVCTQAQIGAANGKIVFNSNRTGDNEIYTMSPDGTNLTRLTSSSGDDSNAKWSPDGTKIVFQSNRTGTNQIYVMNADGSGQTNVSNAGGNNGDPAWSPDGSQIAFTSSRDGVDYEIYVMNTNGANQIQLTNNSDFDGQPHWSPDGSRISFTSARDGNAEIYSMLPNGTGVTRMTNNSVPDSSPQFSPDGSKIVFIRADDVYLMNADGSNQTKIYDPSVVTAFPAFSADGTKIIFTIRNAGNQDDLFAINPDGSGLTQVTTASGIDENASWQPVRFSNITNTNTDTNGKIIFTSNRAGNDDIYTMDSNGANQVRLTDSSFSEFYPLASPDGKKIAFVSYNSSTGSQDLVVMNNNGSGRTFIAERINITSNRANFSWSGNSQKLAFLRCPSDGCGVFTVNADGSNLTRLTQGAYEERNPQLSPDGSKIIFSRRDTSASSLVVNIMNADGTGRVRLTNSLSTELYPFWFPDGAKVLFAGWTSSAGWRLYSINSDGSQQTTLVGSDIGPDSRPAISPDGTKIAFVNSVTLLNTTRIYLMNANGSGLTDLTGSSSTIQYNDPRWSTNGAKLSFYQFNNSTGLVQVFTANANGTGITQVTNTSYSNFPFDWLPYEPSISAAPAANVSVNFASVTQAGNTVAAPLTSAQIPALPTGYSLFAGAAPFDLRTSAAYAGNITVTENVPNVASAAVCASLRLIHFENGAWTTNTNAAPVYTAGTQSCALAQTVTSLSPFAVVQLAPTAANAFVSGRVATADGRGIRGVNVVLTDASGNSRTATTGNFGAYSFDNVPVGAVYTVSVSSKKFSFAEESRIVSVQDDVAGMDFTANEMP